MLHIEHLTFCWNKTQCFTYNLRVARGEILAVQGPSGVGKTTLLELTAGFQTPVSGKITWDGDDLSSLPPWKRPITTVFQSDNLFAHLSCVDNVLIGLDVKIARTPQLLEQINSCFDVLSLGGLQTRLPSEISGGQQQRVALARALMRARPILLLDESFSALDWDMRKECFDALQTVIEEQGMAALLVSHDTRDAAYLGCRTLQLTSS
jgi:thiamine transport system ATP-binding protein